MVCVVWALSLLAPGVWTGGPEREQNDAIEQGQHGPADYCHRVCSQFQALQVRAP